MRRGDHLQEQGPGYWNSLAAATSTDREIRVRLCYAVPTGFLPLALEPCKSDLRALRGATGGLAAMTVVRWGRDRYEEEFAKVMACVETGNWKALLAFIREDPTRLESDERVRGAFLSWEKQQLETGRLEAVIQTLQEIDKARRPLHEADGRQTLAGLGEGIYQGHSLTHMVRNGTEWDIKARAEATLKDTRKKWWPIFFARFKTASYRACAQISAPGANIPHVWSPPR